SSALLLDGVMRAPKLRRVIDARHAIAREDLKPALDRDASNARSSERAGPRDGESPLVVSARALRDETRRTCARRSVLLLLAHLGFDRIARAVVLDDDLGLALAELLVPQLDLVLAWLQAADLERSVGLRDRVIGRARHEHPARHPRMDVALHLELLVLGER